MGHVISKEQLSNRNLFQGAKYGDVPVSFFWVEAQPGSGPRLHVHPYEEIFVRCCHRTWWINRAPSTRTRWAGVFAMRQSGQATSAWSETHPTSSADL